MVLGSCCWNRFGTVTWDVISVFHPKASASGLGEPGCRACCRSWLPEMFMGGGLPGPLALLHARRSLCGFEGGLLRFPRRLRRDLC